MHTARQLAVGTHLLPFSLFLVAITTFAPRDAKALLSANPIPEFPPVTTMFLPFMSLGCPSTTSVLLSPEAVIVDVVL